MCHGGRKVPAFPLVLVFAPYDLVVRRRMKIKDLPDWPPSQEEHLMFHTSRVRYADDIIGFVKLREDLLTMACCCYRNNSH